MNPKEEGRRAFMDNLPENANPYKGDAAIKWKLGYAMEEKTTLEEEHTKALETLNRYDPFGDTINKLDQQINGLQQYLNTTKDD
jgi:hypothetical protein